MSLLIVTFGAVIALWDFRSGSPYLGTIVAVATLFNLIDHAKE